MNNFDIIEETKRLSSVTETQAYEKSKKVNIKFETTQINLPIDNLEGYFMMFSKRDFVKININFLMRIFSNVLIKI